MTAVSSEIAATAAQISATTSMLLAAVFAFALAFGAFSDFSVFATSVFHDPSFRLFASFLVVF